MLQFYSNLVTIAYLHIRFSKRCKNFDAYRERF